MGRIVQFGGCGTNESFRFVRESMPGDDVTIKARSRLNRCVYQKRMNGVARWRKDIQRSRGYTRDTITTIEQRFGLTNRTKDPEKCSGSRPRSHSSKGYARWRHTVYI